MRRLPQGLGCCQMIKLTRTRRRTPGATAQCEMGQVTGVAHSPAAPCSGVNDRYAKDGRSIGMTSMHAVPSLANKSSRCIAPPIGGGTGKDSMNGIDHVSVTLSLVAMVSLRPVDSAAERTRSGLSTSALLIGNPIVNAYFEQRHWQSTAS